MTQQIDFTAVHKMRPIHGNNATILSIEIEYKNGKPNDKITEDCQEVYDSYYNFLINSEKDPEEFIENEGLAESSSEEVADETEESNEGADDVDYEQIDDSNEYEEIEVRHEFTQDELNEMHSELRSKINLHEETEKRQSEMASDYNARKKELLNSMRELSKKIDVGTEDRTIRCRVERDYENGLIRYSDIETNEVLSERPMSHDERQIDAFGNGYDHGAAKSPEDDSIVDGMIEMNDIVQVKDGANEIEAKPEWGAYNTPFRIGIDAYVIGIDDVSCVVRFDDEVEHTYPLELVTLVEKSAVKTPGEVEKQEVNAAEGE